MLQSAKRQKLHQLIDSIENKKVIAIYELLEQEMDTNAQRKRLIMSERENYLQSNSKSYSWAEVKSIVTNKNRVK